MSKSHHSFYLSLLITFLALNFLNYGIIAIILSKRNKSILAFFILLI